MPAAETGSSRLLGENRYWLCAVTGFRLQAAKCVTGVHDNSMTRAGSNAGEPFL